METLLGRKYDFDVVVVGCGPAGIFSALELSEAGLKVLMLDKGRTLDKRNCVLMKGKPCAKVCNPCDLRCGWGGAGAYSDGKLNISSEVGGWLDRKFPPEHVYDLAQYVDSVFVKFGAPEEVHGTDSDGIDELRRKAASARLRLVSFRVRHIGSDNCPKVLRKMEKHLREAQVEIRTSSEVEDLIVENGKVLGVRTTGNQEFRAKYTILCPGRGGAEWLETRLKRLKVVVEHNPVDIGVRVEVPAIVFEGLTNILYDPKLVYVSKTFDDSARTFCVCPHGEVISECSEYHDAPLTTVNGQGFEDRKTATTNFAILVSINFTEPFKKPIVYANSVAQLANLIAGGVIVQRLKDIKNGKRSTSERISRCLVPPTLKDATPGDLSFVLPHRILITILEMLEALDKIAPGVCSDNTYIYGVEAKLYTSRPAVSEELEVRGINNLFMAGDGGGFTRSLMQAAISGVIVARSIIKRETSIEALKNGTSPNLQRS